jgi:hypothetical protein
MLARPHIILVIDTNGDPEASAHAAERALMPLSVGTDASRALVAERIHLTIAASARLSTSALTSTAPSSCRLTAHHRTEGWLSLD